MLLISKRKRKRKLCLKNPDNSDKLQQTSNFILVVLLQLEHGGSSRSLPIEDQDSFTPSLTEREKLAVVMPCTAISGEN